MDNFFLNISEIKKSFNSMADMVNELNVNMKFKTILKTECIEDLENYIKQHPQVFWKKEEELLKAISNNNLPLVKWILEKGANIHYEKESPFAYSMTLKEMDIAQYLWSQNKNSCDNFIPLEMALDHHNLTAVQYLFEIYHPNKLSRMIHLVKKSKDEKMLAWLSSYQLNKKLNRQLTKQESKAKAKI